MSEDAPDDFTAEQAAHIDALLDVLLPATPDGELPSGGCLNVRAFLRARMKDTEGFAATVQGLLQRLTGLLADRQASSLRALDEAEQVALVRQLEAADPLAFMAFTAQAYFGYYTDPSIPPRFGMPDRPPQPLGHKLPQDDLDSLLTPVRAMGKRYRDC